ncbi:MAG: TolC family protein, partial [Bdellovibrionota bacterium]
QQSIKEAQLARDLELELKKALRDVDVGWQRLGALSNAARAQKQRFEAISAKFKAGLVSITTLDKARADAESSELESIKARFAYAKSRLKLAAARGLLLEAAKSRRI